MGTMLAVFLSARLALLIALPLEGLRGFGDAQHFFNLAGMGAPYFDFWSEFPPLFPFFSRLVYLAAGGKQHVYDYLLALTLTLAQAGGIALFVRLAQCIFPGDEARQRGWIYLAFCLALPYGWWYFDPLAATALLGGLCWLVEGAAHSAGIALALGGLTKFFPLIALPAMWRFAPGKRAMLVSAWALGLTAAVLVLLYAASPKMTAASLRSQGSKGSWETPWALLDGNLHTGNFGAEIERFDPQAALQPRGNPPRVSPWLTLLPFAALGGWLWRKARVSTPRALVAFTGLTWCIFFLWSPGYSPQWVLYLLPLVLLALRAKEAAMIAIGLLLVNVLEWPALLSRGYNWGLWLTISVRVFLTCVLAYEFWRHCRPGSAEQSWKTVQHPQSS
ncbi:MAG: hypothetical protein L0Z70_11595 [Chloroflexi bacterium]|nr:hypothetical protein [Chloroflexota bacterium]